MFLSILSFLDGMPVYEGNGNVWQNYKSKLEQESFKLVGTFEAKNPIAQLHEILLISSTSLGKRKRDIFSHARSRQTEKNLTV